MLVKTPILLVAVLLLISIVQVMAASSTISALNLMPQSDRDLYEHYEGNVMEAVARARNHPRVYSWDKPNNWVIAKGKGKVAYEWFSSPCILKEYTPSGWIVQINYYPSPEGGIDTIDMDDYRYPAPGLVIGGYTISIGPWSLGIPGLTYISVDHYKADNLHYFRWTIESYDPLNICDKEGGGTYGIYPQGSTKNHYQTVGAYVFVARIERCSIGAITYWEWFDYDSRTFYLGTGAVPPGYTGHDEYIVPIEG